MLTTNRRFIQAIDPNAGVTRACGPVGQSPVTESAYPVLTGIPSGLLSTRVRPASAAATATAWAVNGRKAMKVDFHDRWPLLSTS